MSVPINYFVIASLTAAAMCATVPAMAFIALLSISLVASANIFEIMTK